MCSVYVPGDVPQLLEGEIEDLATLCSYCFGGEDSKVEERANLLNRKFTSEKLVEDKHFLRLTSWSCK